MKTFAKISTAVFVVLFVFSLSFTAAKDPISVEIDRFVEARCTEIRVRSAAFEEAGASPAAAEVSHTVLCAADTAVSFVINVDGAGAPLFGSAAYYNVDPATGRYLTLEDVFGAGFADIIGDRLRDTLLADCRIYSAEMVLPLVNRGREFYFANGGDSVVLVFEPGEIAPTSAGVVEYKVAVG